MRVALWPALRSLGEAETARTAARRLKDPADRLRGRYVVEQSLPEVYTVTGGPGSASCYLSVGGSHVILNLHSIWQLQSPLPTGQNLHAVEMISAVEGWIAGDNGTILHTTNGGVTWSGAHSGTTAQLNAVRFLDSLHGWAAGNAIVFSTDGGQTWHTGRFSGATLYGVDFVNTYSGSLGDRSEE